MQALGPPFLAKKGGFQTTIEPAFLGKGAFGIWSPAYRCAIYRTMGENESETEIKAMDL